MRSPAASEKAWAAMNDCGASRSSRAAWVVTTMPCFSPGSAASVASRSETMSGCGENGSYGSVSRSGKDRRSSPGPAKKRSSARYCSASRPLPATTTNGASAAAADSARKYGGTAAVQLAPAEHFASLGQSIRWRGALAHRASCRQDTPFRANPAGSCEQDTCARAAPLSRRARSSRAPREARGHARSTRRTAGSPSG